MTGVYTVSQLNRYISFKLKEDKILKGILIRGEISNFTRHAKSGHLYFTLKDGESSVKAVMFNNAASRLMFFPQSGMAVIISANVQVYERDGVYQLYVNDMQPDGIGALYIAYEQLKDRLAEEGIFDDENKKMLPRFPKRIGIATSTDAAALQDMLNIISRRYPIAEVAIYPCLVQGADAPDSICAALRAADKSENDVIILGRGGGSLEDLMAFNSESVARAIYCCKTPIVSAVGHETDTTIADYAADLRAPTPSAAAELVVPELSALNAFLKSSESKLEKIIKEKSTLMRVQLENREKLLNSLEPHNRITALENILEEHRKHMYMILKNRLKLGYAQLDSRLAALDNLSPTKIMTRGYSLVYKADWLVHSASELKSGDDICVKLADGEVNAVIR